MYPQLIDFGTVELFGREVHLAVQSFGLMMVVAYLVGGWLTARELRRRGLSPHHLEGYPLGALIGGIVGARIYYLIEHPAQLQQDFLGSLLSGSGLTWYGGVLGGAITVLVWAKRREQNLWSIADAFAPGLAIAYALGRVGCQLAGDGDYGPPSDLPWAMAYPNGVVATLERCHPTPVYEVLMMLAVTAILWRLRLWSRPPGWLFGVYAMLAGAERWIAELFRVRPEKFVGMSTAQWISLAAIALGLWIVRGRRAD